MQCSNTGTSADKAKNKFTNIPVKYEFVKFNDKPSHEPVMTIWLRDSLYNDKPMAICVGCCSCSVAHQYQYICRHRPLCSDWWIPHTKSHSHQIQCCVCFNHYHMKCITPSPEDLLKLTNERNEWYCPTCLSTIFPYNSIGDGNDFIATITDTFCLSDKSLCYLSDKLFMPFELNDKDHSSALCGIDPELHFYQEFNQATVKCNY